MKRVPRSCFYRGDHAAPITPPCARGWASFSECRVDDFMRPATICVVNMPVHLFATGACRLADVAAKSHDGDGRTPPRFEATAALCGLLCTPLHALVHQSGKPRLAAMREAFETASRGAQHRTCVILEPLKSANNHLVALRVWFVAIDPVFSLSYYIGLQLNHAAQMERACACAPLGRAGSAQRKRILTEDAAEKQESQIPDPATARKRIACTADWLHILNLYANGQELKCGDLHTHLESGVGAPAAVELVEAAAKDRSTDFHQTLHVAAPELVIGLSRQTLAAGLDADVDQEFLSMRSYIGAKAMRFPRPRECFLLVPSGRQDAWLTDLPQQIKDEIHEEHQLSGPGGELIGTGKYQRLGDSLSDTASQSSSAL